MIDRFFVLFDRFHCTRNKEKIGKKHHTINSIKTQGQEMSATAVAYPVSYRPQTSSGQSRESGGRSEKKLGTVANARPIQELIL